MDGVLNEATNTIHKHQRGKSDLQTACGATYHISHDNLRMTSIPSGNGKTIVSKCGRCFDGAGGY